MCFPECASIATVCFVAPRDLGPRVMRAINIAVRGHSGSKVETRVLFCARRDVRHWHSSRNVVASSVCGWSLSCAFQLRQPLGHHRGIATRRRARLSQESNLQRDSHTSPKMLTRHHSPLLSTMTQRKSNINEDVPLSDKLQFDMSVMLFRSGPVSPMPLCLFDTCPCQCKLSGSLPPVLPAVSEPHCPMCFSLCLNLSLGVQGLWLDPLLLFDSFQACLLDTTSSFCNIFLLSSERVSSAPPFWCRTSFFLHLLFSFRPLSLH